LADATGVEPEMMRHYPTYKDSGLEWVGQVPEGWRILPALAVGYERQESNAGMLEENLLSLSYGRIVQKDIDGLDGLLPESFETYQIVYPGDMVLRLTDLQNDKRSLRSAIVRERGIITSAYLAFAPTAIECNYLSYLLRAYDLSKVFYSMGGGLRQGMKFSDIKRMPVLVPPLPEQTAIAAFLDRETAKIDALVAKQRRLIDLLREKRQAVISHAVTKGLNPNAPLKPSGIDWLGDVPEGWEVKRLRFLCKIETGTSDTQDADEDAEYPFFVRSQTVERIGDFTHDCEAVMTSGDGAGVGKIFHHFKGKFSAHQRVYIFTDFAGVLGEFFFHYLKANFFKVALEGGAKSTVDSLRRPLIANFWMTVPPLDTQEEILANVAETELQFSALTATAETAITLLQERRAALISAAVTGKIDVRHLAPEKDAAA
jgi:type I restriction enzyme S subunit